MASKAAAAAGKKASAAGAVPEAPKLQKQQDYLVKWKEQGYDQCT